MYIVVDLDHPDHRGPFRGFVRVRKVTRRLDRWWYSKSNWRHFWSKIECLLDIFALICNRWSTQVNTPYNYLHGDLHQYLYIPTALLSSSSIIPIYSQWQTHSLSHTHLHWRGTKTSSRYPSKCPATTSNPRHLSSTAASAPKTASQWKIPNMAY